MLSISAIGAAFRTHFGRHRWGRAAQIADRASLCQFVQSRASHLAQTCLYGYLRTRAGNRYPELFDSDEFNELVNIAKWHLWLACVSDLAIYAGGLMLHRTHSGPEPIAALMNAVTEKTLADTGTPAEAGKEFPAHAARVRARVALCDWRAVPDDGSVFTESPQALVTWAPLIEEFKRLDDEIVRNSVRFHWREVREHLRRDLDAVALLAAAQAPQPR